MSALPDDKGAPLFGRLTATIELQYRDFEKLISVYRAHEIEEPCQWLILCGLFFAPGSCVSQMLAANLLRGNNRLGRTAQRLRRYLASSSLKVVKQFFICASSGWPAGATWRLSTLA